MDRLLLMTPENASKCYLGLKTMTRRLNGLDQINGNPNDWVFADATTDYLYFKNTITQQTAQVKIPYHAGDRLGIKEAHYLWGCWRQNWSDIKQRMEWTFQRQSDDVYYTDTFPTGLPTLSSHCTTTGWYKRSSMFMFKKDIRTWRTINEVRLEKLQNITEGDAKSEGSHPAFTFSVNSFMAGVLVDDPQKYRKGFRMLWNSINEKSGHGWDKNDWVWCINFKRG